MTQNQPLRNFKQMNADLQMEKKENSIQINKAKKEMLNSGDVNKKAGGYFYCI